MKRFVIIVNIILLLLCCIIPVPGYAGSKEEYDEAYEVYAAAGACLAAYSDRMGKLAYNYLEKDGWEIQPFVQTDANADAGFLLAKRAARDSTPEYILAVVGTETFKDVKTDLRVDKVYFAGHTPLEFAQFAEKQGIPDSAPKVHLGFHQYVQAALMAKTQDVQGNSVFLSELLLANPQSKVYLVGHSLGGAVATLGGARLLSMGVQPEQIEIISFGAPAVGNAAFARAFEQTLHITRVVISGDPVTGVLQKLVGGYVQFGKELRWELPDSVERDPHKMAGYVDLAIKNYYTKRQTAIETGEKMLVSTESDTSGEKVYIAAIENHLISSLQPEFWYMKQAVKDEYRETFPGCLFTELSLEAARKQALEQGCQWVIAPEISGYKLKNEQGNVYVITLQQIVYDAQTGRAVDMASFSTLTYNLTPLEALMHNARDLSNVSKRWLSQN